MNYEASHALNNPKFKRRFGVQRATFKRMVKAVKAQIPERPGPGRPAKLSREDQILVALEYWREYRTYFHIATDRGVSESTVCRIVHRMEVQIMASGLCIDDAPYTQDSLAYEIWQIGRGPRKLERVLSMDLWFCLPDR